MKLSILLSVALSAIVGARISNGFQKVGLYTRDDIYDDLDLHTRGLMDLEDVLDSDLLARDEEELLTRDEEALLAKIFARGANPVHPCTMPGCKRERVSRGMFCGYHFSQLKAKHDPQPIQPKPQGPGPAPKANAVL